MVGAGCPQKASFPMAVAGKQRQIWLGLPACAGHLLEASFPMVVVGWQTGSSPEFAEKGELKAYSFIAVASILPSSCTFAQHVKGILFPKLLRLFGLGQDITCGRTCKQGCEQQPGLWLWAVRGLRCKPLLYRVWWPLVGFCSSWV